MHLRHFDSHSFEYGVSAVQVGLNDYVMNWQTAATATKMHGGEMR